MFYDTARDASKSTLPLSPLPSTAPLAPWIMGTPSGTTLTHSGPTLGDKAWRVDLWFCAQMTEKNWAPRVGYDEASDARFDSVKENAAWGEERAKQ